MGDRWRVGVIFVMHVSASPGRRGGVRSVIELCVYDYASAAVGPGNCHSHACRTSGLNVAGSGTIAGQLRWHGMPTKFKVGSEWRRWPEVR